MLEKNTTAGGPCHIDNMQVRYLSTRLASSIDSPMGLSGLSVFEGLVGHGFIVAVHTMYCR